MVGTPLESRLGEAAAAETEPRDENKDGDEEKGDEEETNGEVEEAPTSIEGIMSALDATRAALNAAQKSLKALNSLPFIIHFGSQKTRITTLESLNFFWIMSRRHLAILKPQAARHKLVDLRQPWAGQSTTQCLPPASILRQHCA
jgi:hypothetical protein